VCTSVYIPAVVNEPEAAQVREIFGLFLREGSLEATLAEIQRRGWRMKSWTTRQGRPHVGQPFDRAALVRLLGNALYCGEVRHKGKVYAGEQAAIVNRGIWRRSQALLRQSKGRVGRGGRRRRRCRICCGAGCAAAGWRPAPRQRRSGGRLTTCAPRPSSMGRRTVPANRFRRRAWKEPSWRDCGSWPKAAGGNRCGRRYRVGVGWSARHGSAGWQAWWNGSIMRGAAGRRGCAGEPAPGRPAGLDSHS
jgi:hypothetical protein